MRLTLRRIAWPMAGLLLVVVVGFIAWRASVSRSDEADFAENEVMIGMSLVEVERSLGDGVYLAAEGPAPEFDTSGLGFEQPIDRTPVAAPESFGRPTVYVGSNPAVEDAGFGGGSLFYYTDYAEPWSRFLGFVGLGERELECLGSKAGAVCVSGAFLNDGPPGAGSETADDPDIAVLIQWTPLPTDTSIVAVSDAEGNPLLWQRPSGRVAHLAIPMEVGATVELQALDSGGQTLAIESFTRCDFTARC